MSVEQHHGLAYLATLENAGVRNWVLKQESNTFILEQTRLERCPVEDSTYCFEDIQNRLTDLQVWEGVVRERGQPFLLDKHTWMVLGRTVISYR